MGFLNMGELGDYPASEMYNRLMQQPDCEMQDYPLSVLAGIGHIRCSEGFASEQRPSGFAPGWVVGAGE